MVGLRFSRHAGGAWGLPHVARDGTPGAFDHGCSGAAGSPSMPAPLTMRVMNRDDTCSPCTHNIRAPLPLCTCRLPQLQPMRSPITVDDVARHLTALLPLSIRLGARRRAGAGDRCVSRTRAARRLRRAASRRWQGGQGRPVQLPTVELGLKSPRAPGSAHANDALQ